MLHTLRRDRVYELLDIAGLTGVTQARREALPLLERWTGHERSVA